MNQIRSNVMANDDVYDWVDLMVGNAPVITQERILGDLSNNEYIKPDKLILCYPVIKSTGPHHQGSFDALLGTGNAAQTPEMLDLLSLEKQVADDTPPSFLWHTFSDPGVPVQSSLEFASALAAHHVPCEMHLYPHGGHGLCLASHITSDAFPADHPFYAVEWIDHAVAFLFDETLGKA